ncbi:deoxyfructose oxidoreductase [Marinobacterium nitratireducens]|uniref:Deoxyfructose oxidoreductase n=1 Tax=Marinobacterium nitratireducens TaxID=518897 RepID=A0A918DVV6_9GAMM|nr:Gfo/Idh/MocA family oxidoreductase [Marinobacterium nitratireducens]GGO84481.1 deoxyfructose oxidoreductase [Marinobacterium nitratireducens]
MHANPDAVRWGIIGTASIARAKIIPALQASPWCEIRAVGSRSQDSAEAFAREFDIPRAYGSYEAVLEDPEVEAVYIPLPNHLHIDIALAAAARGKHVLCEKPVALTAGEAERLRDIPDGILVAEAFMVRYHPQWEALRARLRSGEHGAVCAVQVVLSCTLSNPGDFRFNPDFGGGALYDVGSYAAMTARFIFESEPERVFCAMEHDPANGTDYLCSAILDFGRGRHACFTVGLKMAAAQRVQVICEQSMLELPAPYIATAGAPAEILIDSCTGLENSAPKRNAMPGAEQYEREVTHFAQAVRGRQPLPFGAKDAIRQMRVIDALFASAISGTWEMVRSA